MEICIFSTMIKKGFFVLLMIMVTIGKGHAQEWNQDNLKTSVTFKIKNFGVTVNGRFHKIAIKTNLDTYKFSESYLNASIAVPSIATGIVDRDKHLLEEEYFNASTYHNITFVTTKIEKSTQGTYFLRANLTIKGITKKVTVPINFQQTDHNIMIQAAFEINRRDFNVGGGSMIMSKKVKIHVQFTGTR